MNSTYLKLSIRQLRSGKAFLFINLLGLTIGIASFILIFFWIRAETSYDRFHRNAGDVYRLDYLLYEEGILEQHSASGGAAVAREMKSLFPEIKNFTRFSRTTALVKYGDLVFKEKKILYAESSFFDIFSFPLAKGRNDSILAINNAVMTESAALKYFGPEDAIGKIIKIDGRQDFIVSGIVKDPPGNSHLEFDILLSYDNLIKTSRSWDNSWVNERVYSYILCSPGTDPHSVEAKIPQLVESFIGAFMKEAFFKLEFRLVRLPDIHLHSSINNEIKVNGSYRSVVTLGIVAVLVLLIAFVNYINLATSRSLERAHEVGVRKVTGASRKDLINQFLTESALLNFLALVISFALVFLLMPFFRQLMDSPMRPGMFIPVMLFFILMITGTLFTGLFPAIYISNFTPGLVLKGKNPRPSQWIARFKNFFVLFQFTASIVLITCTIVILSQVKYMQNHDTGFTKEGLLVVEGPRVINANSNEAYLSGLESFRNDVLSLPSVNSITGSSVIPGREVANSRVFGVPVDGRNTEKRIDVYYSDNMFNDTYRIKLLAGENFGKTQQEDVNKVVLNQSALVYYGFGEPENAVGKILRGGEQEVVIKGVISDFNQLSLKELPRPLAFFNQPVTSYFTIRAETDNSGLINGLEKVWNSHYPGNPFIYYFLEDYYNDQYKADNRFFVLFLISSFLAIIIACLGLYGLSAYAISRRTKEIGIRKSNGSTAAGVMILLNRDFLKWVFLAMIISIPVSWLAMDRWLENYAYRRPLSWWIFVMAGIIAVFIAFITISWQSWAAARRNPVEALRYE